MRILIGLSLAAASLLLTACDDIVLGSNWSAYREDFHYTYPLSASGSVSVQNANGEVDISGWDQNTVEISGAKYANTQEGLKDLRVDVASQPGAITIRTVRAQDWPHEGGVRYSIRVPRGAKLDDIVTSNGPIRVDTINNQAHLRTSNGPVNATGIKGALDVETSNGPVRVNDLEGPATVRTSNGPIQLTMDTVQEIHATTSNGPITVRLPASAGASLHAHTSHGPIHSDFDMNVHDTFSRNNLDGIIGNGGPSIDLETSNGPIKLVRW